MGLLINLIWAQRLWQVDRPISPKFPVRYKSLEEELKRSHGGASEAFSLIKLYL